MVTGRVGKLDIGHSAGVLPSIYHYSVLSSGSKVRPGLYDRRSEAATPCLTSHTLLFYPAYVSNALKKPAVRTQNESLFVCTDGDSKKVVTGVGHQLQIPDGAQSLV